MQLYQNNFQCRFNSDSYQHHHDQRHKVFVALIDIYEYRCEREDQINLDALEERIEKLEKEQ